MISSLRSASICVCLVAAGCAGQKPHDLVAETAIGVETKPLAVHTIYVATTRAQSDAGGEVFSGARSPVMSYARVSVSIPQSHEPGKLSRPKRGTVDPAKHIAAREIGIYTSEDAAKSAIDASIADKNGRALVFIHGYNNKFDGAVYRMAQLVHDSGYDGTPVLFTWASAGRTVDYLYDKDSATAARDALEQTLLAIAATGATRIDIIAHSMGSWITMEALRQLAIGGKSGLQGKLGDVVLASPDVDVDVFKSQMTRIGVPQKHYFVLISNDDKALKLSSLIAGNKPRVGDYSSQSDLAQYGVILVDLSGIEGGDGANHTKFADNPVLVRLLGERLSDPNAFSGSGSQISDKIGTFARGIGSAAVSAAEIVITTPVEILRVAVGD